MKESTGVCVEQDLCRHKDRKWKTDIITGCKEETLINSCHESDTLNLRYFLPAKHSQPWVYLIFSLSKICWGEWKGERERVNEKESESESESESERQRLTLNGNPVPKEIRNTEGSLGEKYF